MDDAPLVGRGEGVGERDGDVEDRSKAGPPRGISCARVRPSTHSMTRKWTPPSSSTRVQGDDVRVVQGGDGARLAREALDPLALGLAQGP